MLAVAREAPYAFSFLAARMQPNDRLEEEIQLGST